MDLNDTKRLDVSAAQPLEFPTDSIAAANRAYLDFNRMREMHQAGVFFIIRGKENIRLYLKERPIDKENPDNKSIKYDWQAESELYSSRLKFGKNYY